MRFFAAASALFASLLLEHVAWSQAQTPAQENELCRPELWTGTCGADEFLTHQDLFFVCLERCAKTLVIFWSCGHCPGMTPVPSAVPSAQPSLRPTLTQVPSTQPSARPSATPSSAPSAVPSTMPSVAPRRVFVTSSTYQGSLGGLAGADAICQSLADAKKLVGTFKAWLSDSTGSPDSRFSKSTNGPYILMNGDFVARNWDDLVDGKITNPISIDENGQEVVDYVYTNTNTLGTATVAVGNSDCVDWSSNSANSTLSRPSLGHSSVVPLSHWWTQRARTGRNSDHCASYFHLYCFEQF